MATDIFNREVDLGTPMAADQTRLLFPNLGNTDMMVQQVAIQYAQNINRLWEVGSANTYFIAGRTQGTVSLKRVVGGQGISSDFIKEYGDVCNMAGNTLTFSFQAGCTPGSNSDKGDLTCSGAVINSLAYSVAAADMIINEDLTMMFARLESASS